MLRHRLEPRNVEIAEQALQRRAAFVAKRKTAGHALGIVLGVEEDHAALLHVGVDLGKRGFRQRPGICQHRPVEDREEGDLVGEDVDGERLARLHGGARDQELAEADEALAARLVGGGIAGEHVAEGDFGCRLDSAPVVASASRGRLARLRAGRIGR